MKVLMNDISSNRDEWLKLRSKTVGSSEISTIVGLNKWDTPLKLWMRKTGREDAIEDNDAMRLGRMLESFIGEKFARDNEKFVAPANILLSHEVHDSFTASPDFWILDEDKPDTHSFDPANISGVVECKNVNYRLLEEWEDGNCPNHAQIQLQWQLGVTGLSGGYVAGLVGAQVNNFYSRHFEADAKIIDNLFESAYCFLEMVKSDTPPQAVASDRKTVEDNMKLNNSFVRLPESAVSLLSKYLDVSLERKGIEETLKKEKDIENSYRVQLETMLGDSSVGIVGDYFIQAKRVHKGSYVVDPHSYVLFTVKPLDKLSKKDKELYGI